MTMVAETMCVACEGKLTDGVCLNVDCPEGARAATADAVGEGAKVNVAGAVVERRATRPAAWNNVGRVD